MLEQVAPQLRGLEVRVAQLTYPVLFVRNRTTRPMTVEGQDGEPFLRIGPRRVRLNVSSPTTYLSTDPTRTTMPAAAPSTPEVRWKVVDRGRSWSWFDPRLRDPTDETWQVNARVGKVRLTITGSFEELGRHGHFQTEIVSLNPEIGGLEMRLLDGRIPAVFVRNDTGGTLHVPGERGEPFLRIGPRGVFANSRSPEYYRAGALTVRPVPLDLDPRSQPSWERLSTEPLWSWLEYRARLPATAEQRVVLGDEPRTVLEWVTPMMLGDRPLRLEGRVRWIPPHVDGHRGQERPSPARSPLSTVLVVLLLVGAFAVIAAVSAMHHRRRSSAGTG